MQALATKYDQSSLDQQPKSIAAMTSNTILINGDWVGASQTMQIINSFDNSVIAEIGCADNSHVAQAIISARQAFKQNQFIASHQRAAFLKSAANKITDRIEEFATTIALETGKPIVAARKEVTRC